MGFIHVVVGFVVLLFAVCCFSDCFKKIDQEEK
mgnify:CR=1 FL=1